ncbi:MAG TPA: extradiol ring-cleavage dioxygenase [Methylomirabilota bacterium]|jgi:3,4-dihydroxyphenylacetate 2,3-dioxygenase|nr:extradiol ring-cleavage dioxygenase [Methylomirabilota bacterium]
MGILAGVFLSVHTPRYCTLEAAFEGKLASEVFRPVRDGLAAQGALVAQSRLDVVVLNSCHLIATFPTVVDGTPRHRGVLTAQEAPELIHGVAYDYPGDHELAGQLIAKGKAAGRPCVLANDVHYPLDYGTVMPMVCYLDPAQKLPLVPVSVCLAADLNESYEWGRSLAQVAQESGKRVGFVASGAVSHKLVRGPEKGPSPEDEALDHRFATLLAGGEYAALWTWLPEFARTTQAEMGGRHLAMLLGAVMESGQRFASTVHAYGPSSGSGNYVISLLPA